MGADARIRCVRVGGVDEPVIGGNAPPPQFVIHRPSVILPVHPTARYPSVVFIDERLLPEVAVGDGQVVLIPQLLALVVVPINAISEEMWSEWKMDPPGGEPLTHLRRAWRRLVPGRWVVTDYLESTSDNIYTYRAPWLRKAKGVTWEIWS